MLKYPKKYFFIFFICLALSSLVTAQRTYAPHSVLSAGNWYRFSVGDAGIYKLDLAFLSQLGIPTAGLSSNSIKVFGNGGSMLPENPGARIKDDLQEIALWVEDGGDGVLNGTDYVLFFAPGTKQWLTDSLSKSFRHLSNLYSDKSFYYLTIGTNGKRISLQTPPSGAPDQTVNSYDFRYFHELDTVNFLSSGKQWFGEEFSNQPGKPLSRTFSVTAPGILSSQASVKLALVSRSIGQPGSFQVSLSGSVLGTAEILPVSNGSYDLFAQSIQKSFPFSAAAPGLQFQLGYTPGSIGSQGWLDWMEVFARCKLSLEGLDWLMFRDWNAVHAGGLAAYDIATVGTVFQIWDISNAAVPQSLPFTSIGTGVRFLQESSQLHEFIAFNKNSFRSPIPEGKISNQDLHASISAPLLIISNPLFLPQAQRLAAFHARQDSLKSLIVSTEAIYHEFSSGIPDPTAIRDFVKMQYDLHRLDSTNRPRYVLLFGDASFDYKGRIQPNENLLPAFETASSLDPLTTYVSDDFYGFLDDGDDMNSLTTPLLDLGVGRLPASNLEEATNMVDKILSYDQPAALGNWRNEISLVADDEDNNLHFNDAEFLSQTITNTAPVFKINKFYLDAYHQESSPAGSRYPELNLVLENKFRQGNLIWNYVGHGGFRRLAEEVVLDQQVINSLDNAQRLPLFITATCDVAPYDNPLINSIGEDLLVRPKTGAIALMVTTRLVFAYSNRIMNNNYLSSALRKMADGRYPTLGMAVMMGKNLTYSNNTDLTNNRKFTLLGDPALRLAFPRYQVVTTEINGKPFLTDTLRAVSTYTIGGEVRDENGQLMQHFNGVVYPTIYDKPSPRSTLGNDPGSQVAGFMDRQHLIFKGKSTVKDGKFQFSLVVPKDIDYRFGAGTISYYAENGKEDGQGDVQAVVIGGTGAETNDKTGPTIKAYLNSTSFVNGSITGEKPRLLVELADSSGINVSGNGIGHQLLAILDGKESTPFVLDSYYESNLDSYKEGKLVYQLPALEKGPHQLTVRAWDAANNMSEKTIDFSVELQTELKLEHVLNYPNPFTSRTAFWFEHNRQGESLQVTVDIYTITGKRVQSLNHTIISEGNRSMEVNWDGCDEYGSKLGRGVYLYRLRVRSSDGKQAEALEKLYIL